MAEEIYEYVPKTVFPPGEVLAEKLQEMGMGPKEFALRTDKPEKTIIAVLKGESSITADMAVRFENVTGIPVGYWLNHQRGYDEFVAREKRKKVIQQALPWAKKFPVGEMINKGWLPQIRGVQEKTSTLLGFFGFSNHHAWEEYYFKQQLKVAFRISLKKINEPYAVSVWLRKGELQAAELLANPYSSKIFKKVLPDIRALMNDRTENLFDRLQQICLEAGVKVVHTPRINKAGISGSTRWIRDTPLIQLSDSLKQNHQFWFTFFHEAGHILLHGKKDIFLEKIEYSDKDLIKENEADAFAEKWMKS
jgi:addiction module HigA family antidote